MPSLLSKYRKKRDSTRSDDGSDRGSFGKSPTRKVSTSSSFDSAPVNPGGSDLNGTPRNANNSAPNSSKRANGLGLQLNGAVPSPNRSTGTNPGTSAGGSPFSGGTAGTPAQMLAGYSTAQMGDGAYMPPRQPQHLNSPFMSREDPNQVASHTSTPASMNSQADHPESQQQRDLEQLREHDRTFQERYKQFMSSPPTQSPAHFFNLPASENPWAEWQIRRACPSPRFGHSANYIAARDGELFIMGGIRDMDILNDLWVIDTHMLTGYQLRTEGASVSSRVGHAALTLGNAYILFGGDTKIQETDPLDNNLYLLNTTTLRWTVAEPKGPRPCGRYGHSLVNVGVKVFVFGGQVDDMFYNDMWMFDLTTLRSPSAHWEKIEPLTPAPPPRTNHTVVTYQDKIYLFGGANRDLWYSDTWCYDPAMNEWNQLDCTGYVPAPCQGHAATMIGDTMYVFGGMSSQGNLIDQLFALKLTTHKWYTFQNLGQGPCPRSGHSLTAFDGDKILVWGGTDQSSSAFVLDVSRINYPDETMEIDADAIASVSSSTELGRPANGSVSEIVEPPAQQQAHATQPVQLTRETSARSTPAARNSILLKRQSWQQNATSAANSAAAVGAAGNQPQAPQPQSQPQPVPEDEEFVSTTDLPLAQSASGPAPVAPLAKPARVEPVAVPVMTSSELARSESAGEQLVPQVDQAEPSDQQAKAFDQHAEPFDQQAEPFDQQAEPFDQQDEPFSQQAEPFDQQTEPHLVPVKDAESLEEATAGMPGALPRSDGVLNLTEASEQGSGTPDTLWRATSSSSEDTEVGSNKDVAYNKLDAPVTELEPVSEMVAGPVDEAEMKVADIGEDEPIEAESTSTPEIEGSSATTKVEPTELAKEPTQPAAIATELAKDSTQPVAAPAEASEAGDVVAGMTSGVAAGVAAVGLAKHTERDIIPPRNIDVTNVENLQSKLADFKRRQDQDVEARQSLANARRELLDNREELSKVKSDHAILQNQYTALHESTAQQVALVAAAKDAIAAAEAKAAAATERADTLATENAKLKEQIESLQTASADREVDTKHQNLHSRIDELLAKWSIFPGAAGPRLASEASEEREISGSTGSVDHYQELYESQKKVIDESHADLNEAYGDIAELQKELKQLQAELAEVSTSAASAKELSIEHDKIQAELVTLRNFRSMSTQQTEKLEAELKQKAERCDELEAEYNKSVEYLQNQQNALSKTRAELVRVKEDNTRLQDELSDAKLMGPPPDGNFADADASSHSVGSLNYRQAELIIKDLKTQLIIAEEERDELRDQVRNMKKAALANKV